MKEKYDMNINIVNIKRLILYLPLVCLLAFAGCIKGMKSDDIQEQPVDVRIMLSEALRNLGWMTDIYGSKNLKIQCAPLTDQSGAEWRKGGENSRRIMNSIKTAISSIGGKVRYIPYDPVFSHTQMVTYETEDEKRLLPDVIIEGEIARLASGCTAKYGGDCSAGLVFTLIDFPALTSVPRVRTDIDMNLTKAEERRKRHVILTSSFYKKEGDIDRAKSGEQAMQMLVEFGMIQLIGKHLRLPYWKILNDTKADPVVLDSIKQMYLKMGEAGRIAKVQEFLFLHGYDVRPTGILNMETKIALQDYEGTETLFHRPIDQKLFFSLYLSLPITDETLERRFYLDRLYPSS